MSDLLAELDEQMRVERMQALWKRHGKLVIAALVAVVLATAAYSGYQEWDKYQKTRNTESLYSILKDENFPANVTAGAHQDLPSDLRALVFMNAAGAYLNKTTEEGKSDTSDQSAALALYEDVAKDIKISQPFRDLALLSGARLKLVLGMEKPAGVLGTIKPLLQQEEGAYYAQALLEAAALYAAEEDYRSALSLLEKLNATTGLPDTIYLKARTLAHVYELKQWKVTNQPS